MQVNVSKKELMIFAAALVLIASIFSVTAALTGAWHPLQQVSTDATGSTSIDANSNGKVDDADKVGGLSSSQLLAAGGGVSTITIAYPSTSSSCTTGFDVMNGRAIAITGGAVTVGTSLEASFSSSDNTLSASKQTGSDPWCVKTGVTSAQAYTYSTSQASSATCAQGFTQIVQRTAIGGSYDATYSSIQNDENGIILGVATACSGTQCPILGVAREGQEITMITTPHSGGSGFSDPAVIHCVKTA